MKTTDLFKVNRSSQRLNETFEKTFGKRLDLSSFDLPKLEDARNRIRTQLSQVHSQSGFNENIENEAVTKAQWMLDAINAEIAERQEFVADPSTTEVKEGADVDKQELMKILKQFDEDMNEIGGYGDPDFSKVLAALNQGDVEAAIEEVWYSYTDQDGGEVRNMDPYIEDLEDEFKYMIGDHGDEGGETDDAYALASAGFGSDEDYGDYGRDESIQQEGDSPHTYMSIAQEVYAENPDLDDEDEILNAAFPHVVTMMGGNKKRANYMFNYDEDFPSDMISAYKWLQRHEHDVGEDVAEGSFGSGYGSVFTLYVNTGEKPATKTKTKKFKREDDAVLWAEDYADQHEMFPNLKMEIQDENGNVVWELEESQGVAEAAKWRDPKYKDRLYTQEPGDSDDYDNIGYGYDFPERPENDPGQKRRMGGVGSEFDHNDPLKKGQGIGRSGIKHSLNMAGKRKGLPSRDQITSLKGSIKSAHGSHPRPRFPKEGMEEGGFGRDAYERDYDASVSGMGRRERDWDEGDKEPANNFAVYINGKKWKVFAGHGTYADDRREMDQYRKLQDWARKKSEATGKKWEVSRTGEPATESVEEVSPPGFKGTVKAMKKHKEVDNPYALAWSMKNKGYKSHKKADGSDKNESVNTGDDMTRLQEGEVQQASAIVTAKTMVDRVSRWIEELSGMENDTLLQLGDSIRDEMGSEQAKTFISAVAPAIQQALENLKTTRETLSTGVRQLTGEEQGAEMLGSEPGAEGAMGGEEDLGAAEPDMMNAGGEEAGGDEFAAAEPAAGGLGDAGREQRESINRSNSLLRVLAG